MLLLILTVLGFAGSQYIGMGMDNDKRNGTGGSNSPQTPPPEQPICGPTVTAEIELVFSSPPLSYTLTQPSATTGGEDKVVLKSSPTTDNPYYGTVRLVSHEHTTYWFDVTWPEDAESGTYHFVKIHISPNHGESQNFCFYSSMKDMNETFEYHTGDHHHE